MIEAKLRSLCDKAYDSDDLDNDLGKQGIDMIAARKSNRVKIRHRTEENFDDIRDAG